MVTSDGFLLEINMLKPVPNCKLKKRIREVNNFSQTSINPGFSIIMTLFKEVNSP